MALYNPFAFIIETRTSPHARTLRTTLWQKVKDTWQVIAGQRTKWINPVQPGLLDYANLMMEGMLSQIFWRLRKETRDAKGFWPTLGFGILTGLLALPVLPLTLLRISLSLAATLAALPIVFFVHIIARGVDGSREDGMQQASAVSGSLMEQQIFDIPTVPITLGGHLGSTPDGDMEHLEAGIREGTPSSYVLSLQPRGGTPLYINCSPDTIKTNPGIRALFTHNIGGLTSILERDTDGDYKDLTDALNEAVQGATPSA